VPPNQFQSQQNLTKEYIIMGSQESTISRKAVVTGAGRGLGRAMALGLLNAGHSVLIVDQRRAAVQDTLNVARSLGHGGRVFGLAVDLTEKDAVSKVLATADTNLGGIEILVNNAGIGPDALRKNYLGDPPKFDEIPDDLVRLFFDVNGVAPLLLAMHATRRMRRAGWGRIVNVTTSTDSMMRPGFVPYGGSKASLEAHSAAMAQELEGTGITVNVLVPGGAADTDMVPDELGFDRSTLVRPEAMVPPLLWFVGDGPGSPNGKRVVAATWTPDADASGHPSVRPIGWPGVGSAAITPTISA
jgi:NAD(P)-dependent dehydrogenase (short-subunit alcohol dehydrogenase family)